MESELNDVRFDTPPEIVVGKEGGVLIIYYEGVLIMCVSRVYVECIIRMCVSRVYVECIIRMCVGTRNSRRESVCVNRVQ